MDENIIEKIKIGEDEYCFDAYAINGNNSIQTKSNLVTSINKNSKSTEYPSAKCIYNLVGDIESLKITTVNTWSSSTIWNSNNIIKI